MAAPVLATPGNSNAVTLVDDVVINEIMYHHQPADGPYRESDEEWLDLYNRGTATVDLAAWELSDGIGHDIWHEFCLCLLGPGEVLLDDVSVVEDPDGNAVEFMQNGTFDSDTAGSAPASWRLLGTHGSHGRSVVVTDPDSPGNRVLHLVSTGDYKHEHNHIETTFARARRSRRGAKCRGFG